MLCGLGIGRTSPPNSTMSAAKFHLRSGELNANVLIQVGWVLAGTVSAEMQWPEHWWLSRLKLQRPYRGRGIAEQALALLMNALATPSGPKSVRVCPGGYGSHLPSLMRWYRIQGFREVDAETLEFDLDRTSGIPV